LGLGALVAAATELAVLGKRLDAAAAAWCRANPEVFEHLERFRALGNTWLVRLHEWARDNPETVEMLMGRYQPPSMPALRHQAPP